MSTGDKLVKMLMNESEACLVTVPELCKDMEKDVLAGADKVFVDNDLMNQMYEDEDIPSKELLCGYKEESHQSEADDLLIAKLMEEDLNSLEKENDSGEFSLRPASLNYREVQPIINPPTAPNFPNNVTRRTNSPTKPTTKSLLPMSLEDIKVNIFASAIADQHKEVVVNVLTALFIRVEGMEILDIKPTVERWASLYRFRVHIPIKTILHPHILQEISLLYKEAWNITWHHPYPQSTDRKVLSIGMAAKRQSINLQITPNVSEKMKALNNSMISTITQRLPTLSVGRIHAIVNEKVLFPMSESLFDVISAFSGKSALDIQSISIDNHVTNDCKYVIHLELASFDEVKPSRLSLGDLNVIVDTFRQLWDLDIGIVLNDKQTTTFRVEANYLQRRKGLKREQIINVVTDAVTVMDARTPILDIITSTVDEFEVCIHKVNVVNISKNYYQVKIDLDSTVKINREREVAITDRFNDQWAIAWQHSFPKSKNIHRIIIGLTSRTYII